MAGAYHGCAPVVSMSYDMPLSKMPENIPALLHPLLNQYLGALDDQLPGLVEGCYIHGSLALDAFHSDQSDIDFVSVTSRSCTDDDIERLTDIHQTLAKKFPKWPLQGSYIRWRDLGKFADSVQPGPVFSDNHLRPHSHHDLNAITWWILKNRGIALIGPAPETLDFVVDWELLLDMMLENLNTYWVRFTREPGRILWLFSDYGIQWTVLGVLRQFYTFREQDITSKIGAGDYGLQSVPARWHRLIQEAIIIRNQTGLTLYRSRITRAIEAFRFLKFIINRCNTDFADYKQVKEN